MEADNGRGLHHNPKSPEPPDKQQPGAPGLKAQLSVDLDLLVDAQPQTPAGFSPSWRLGEPNGPNSGQASEGGELLAMAACLESLIPSWPTR